MQELCLGYKLNLVSKQELIKRQIVADIIGDMYFSQISKFYEEQYNLGLINDEISFSYEGSSTFSHVIIMAQSKDVDSLYKNIYNYIEKIKKEEIDLDLFNLAKNKKIGEMLLLSDGFDTSYRRIIDKALNGTNMYDDIEILKNLSINDVKSFLNLLDNNNNLVKSVIIKK